MSADAQQMKMITGKSSIPDREARVPGFSSRRFLRTEFTRQ
jgi:hypothetical protein